MAQDTNGGQPGQFTGERAVAPVKIVADLVYATPNGSPQRLDLYLPQVVERPLPVIMWLHGGGWRFGRRHLCGQAS